jgi:hypothetical protein
MAHPRFTSPGGKLAYSAALASASDQTIANHNRLPATTVPMAELHETVILVMSQQVIGKGLTIIAKPGWRQSPDRHRVESSFPPGTKPFLVLGHPRLFHRG